MSSASNFLSTAATGGSTTQSLASAAGLPPCLLNIANNVLALLPTAFLNSVSMLLTPAIEAWDSMVKDFINKLRDLFGFIAYTDENGTTIYIFKYFIYGLSPFTLLKIIDRFTQAIMDFAMELFSYYQEIMSFIDDIKDCFSQLRKTAKDSLVGGEGALRDAIGEEEYNSYITSRYQQDLMLVQHADQEKTRALDLLARINRILADRRANPDLEPCMGDLTSTPEGVSMQETLISLGIKFCDPRNRDAGQGGGRKEVFRLAYGPPESREGRFLKSVDGLYFDSQASGITPALLEVNNRSRRIMKDLKWKLEHDPNLGGRGKQISIESVKGYISTMLDINEIDESSQIQNHYEKDELLQTLIGQKNRKVFDASKHLEDAITEGAHASIIDNLRQAILSESSHSQSKINKRKKQIELARSLGEFQAGEVPVNDFSYLEGQNYLVATETQRKLVLDQQEVSGVVLPLDVRYSRQIEVSHDTSFDHLLINQIGLGGIVSDGSGVIASKLNINTPITSDSLLALYNLLNFKFSDTSSTSYDLNNSSDYGEEFNAQLVAGDETRVFSKGVGIAYLEGITKNSSLSPKSPSSVGSYIKLNSTGDMQGFLYGPNGATFETWIKMPDFASSKFDDSVAGGDASSLYRLILANENTGLQSGASKQPNILTLNRDPTTDTVKGLIFGFTRDRRFTQNEEPSNLTNDNPFNDTCLILAPTQSYDSSSIGFLHKPSTNCDLYYSNNEANSWCGLTIPLSSTINGVSLSSVANEFCQLTVTFDHFTDKVSVYLDGKVMAVSSYNDVFGITSDVKSLSLPTLIKPNSFEYNSTQMMLSQVEALKNGPKLGKYFTPWIIGGGYTDGLKNGNFMGGTYGGVTSGLKGYLGGIKIYSKPLIQSEILNNYEASKTFFKNIKL